MPSINILLYRGSKNTNLKEVALVSFSGISVQACVRPTETCIECSLRELSIEDLLQPWGEKFKYLLRTNRELQNSGGSQDNLIQLDYRATPFVSRFYYFVLFLVYFVRFGVFLCLVLSRFGRSFLFQLPEIDNNLVSC